MSCQITRLGKSSPYYCCIKEDLLYTTWWTCWAPAACAGDLLWSSKNSWKRNTGMLNTIRCLCQYLKGLDNQIISRLLGGMSVLKVSHNYRYVGFYLFIYLLLFFFFRFSCHVPNFWSRKLLKKWFFIKYSCSLYKRLEALKLTQAKISPWQHRLQQHTTLTWLWPQSHLLFLTVRANRWGSRWAALPRSVQRFDFRLSISLAG